MTNYRLAKPEERNDFVDLANYTFGFDIEALLPKVYYEGDDSWQITKVAENQDGKLVAEVAVLPQTLHAGGKTLNTNFLGIMVVHPRHRSEGHMKALMKSCLDEMPGNYHMSVLDGKRQRYEYFGYTLGGMMRDYKVIPDNIRHALKNEDSSGICFIPLTEVDGWETFVTKLHTSHNVYVERNPQQLENILACYNQHGIGVQKDGKLIGYLLVNKDKTAISEFEVIHTEDTKKIVKAYFETFPIPSAVFTVPGYDTKISKEFSDFAELYTLQSANMYHIFDFAAVMEAFLNVKYQTYGLSEGVFSAVMDGQPVTVSVDKTGVHVERKAAEDAVILNHMDAQKLLVTPYGSYMDLPVPRDWFPLPLFWYTVDCF